MTPRVLVVATSLTLALCANAARAVPQVTVTDNSQTHYMYAGAYANGRVAVLTSDVCHACPAGMSSMSAICNCNWDGDGDVDPCSKLNYKK